MSLKFNTDVIWEKDHIGNISMGNGPQMKFSAPPDDYGKPDVLTPEDAFVGSINMCFMLMFLWACERYKINLISYSCQAEGTKQIFLDKTEKFTFIVLKPSIVIKNSSLDRVKKALQSAQKYSLISNSITGRLSIEPTFKIE